MVRGQVARHPETSPRVIEIRCGQFRVRIPAPRVNRSWRRFGTARLTGTDTEEVVKQDRTKTRPPHTTSPARRKMLAAEGSKAIQAHHTDASRNIRRRRIIPHRADDFKRSRIISKSGGGGRGGRGGGGLRCRV
ncbi:glycosyl transferase family 1 [Anopheles sinensis]|uniref:Glycosyl transferase family 1 n=1 Tax=Anopheles sinensis TaxID=74873 RepID=A0A084W7N1_ANOSI|nr:glycosyl transferase family 1 [Anopheles sinensis]